MSHPLVLEIARLTQRYAGRGGKDNRRQQRLRMLAFAQHAAAGGTRALANLGKRQVIAYWKDHAHLSDSTLYNHWCALCILWQLQGKPGKPPKPRKKEAKSPEECP